MPTLVDNDLSIHDYVLYSHRKSMRILVSGSVGNSSWIKDYHVSEMFLHHPSGLLSWSALSSSDLQALDVSEYPERENFKKGERVTLRVQSVGGAGFYVWRIDGYGQRVIETKIPELSLAFTETSDLSKDPVEVGLKGAPQRVDLRISVSAYDNHFLRRLLARGESQVAVMCEVVPERQ